MRGHRFLLGLIFAVGALCIGTGQTQAQPQPGAGGGQSAVPAVTAKMPKGCKAGQMRCVGAAARKAAAIRNADRRAQHIRRKRGH